MKKVFGISLILVFLLGTGAIAQSLWNKDSVSAFASQRPFKIGDVIMVLVVESTSALQKVGTDTQNQDNLSASLNHTLQRLYGTVGPSNSFQASKGSAYKGTGSTTRSSNLSATIAVTVKEVFPNGNLLVSGTHKLSVNEDSQEIMISGIVRPNDVTGWNTVYSYQVADASISVKGAGVAGDMQSPGMIMRFLNWLF